MARAKDTFALALAALRSRLRDGRFAPGAMLNATELAQALDMSLTPVREALAHLAGEGLVQERRGLGYFALRLQVGELGGLYRLHGLYLAAAVTDRAGTIALPPRPAPQEPDGDQSLGGLQERAQWERLFTSILAASDDHILHEAQRRCADRLAPARLHEGEVLDALEDERLGMAAALSAGDARLIRNLLRRYHERRIAAAERIAARLDRLNHYNP